MEEEIKSSKKIFYGWIVCLTGALLIFITMGTVSNGFSVFLPFIIKEHGLTNSQASSLVTLRCVFSFISMLFIGRFYNRTGYRKGTVIAVLCAFAAFTVYSFSSTYPAFAAGAAISGFSYGLGSMIPVSIIMNNWFVDHKALAIGICASGSGIATVVLPPVCTRLIETCSMKITFRCMAVFILVIAIVIAVLMRERPSDKGLTALGKKEHKETQASDAIAGPSYGPTKKGWIYMAVVCLSMGALANPGFVHLSVLFTSEGFKPMVVAAAISLTGVLLVVSKIFCGSVTDRVGGKKSTLLFGTVLVIGHVMCCFAFLKSVPFCMATVFVLGLGYPLATIGPSIWAVDMASQDQYPKVVRRFQVIYAGGALVFASVPGIMADFFGNYISAYILFAGLMVVAVVLAVLGYRENARQKKELFKGIRR